MQSADLAAAAGLEEVMRALTVRLANDPLDYARYKALFTAQAWQRSIGDIDRFTTQFEATWCRVIATMCDN